MKQEIYILTHKKINYGLDLSKYIPIQCGAQLSTEDIYKTKDNIGKNISNLNKLYLETTGIYWIWQNSNADIKGNMQFRRFLSVNPEFIPKILEEYDIIFAKPLSLSIGVQFHYEICHNIDDIINIRNILVEYFPKYISSYDLYINRGKILYYSNSFIAKKEIYDGLCEFVFSVLKIFCDKYNYYDDKILTDHAKESLTKWSNEKERIRLQNINSHTDIDKIEYQKRICGYLFERLVTLYVFHNKLNVYECGEYIRMENNIKI